MFIFLEENTMDEIFKNIENYLSDLAVKEGKIKLSRAKLNEANDIINEKEADFFLQRYEGRLESKRELLIKHNLWNLYRDLEIALRTVAEKKHLFNECISTLDYINPEHHGLKNQEELKSCFNVLAWHYE